MLILKQKQTNEYKLFLIWFSWHFCSKICSMMHLISPKFNDIYILIHTTMAHKFRFTWTFASLVIKFQYCYLTISHRLVLSLAFINFLAEFLGNIHPPFRKPINVPSKQWSILLLDNKPCKTISAETNLLCPHLGPSVWLVLTLQRSMFQSACQHSGINWIQKKIKILLISEYKVLLKNENTED